MGLARLFKWVGVVALAIGIIGFLLPGNFIYSPTLNTYLTQYGNAFFPGISSDTSVKILIAKAPAIGLALIGFVLIFWGFIRDLTESPGPTGKKNQDTQKSIQELVELQKAEGKKKQDTMKSASELADRKKP
jgi:hypothetical protein